MEAMTAHQVSVDTDAMSDSDLADTAGINRRQFVVRSAAAGGFLIGLAGVGSNLAAAQSVAASVGAWVRIDTSGGATVLCGSSEMGQGVMSGLAQVLAEELKVDWTKVQTEHAPASAVYGNPRFGGLQLTGGSSSIRGYYNAMRLAGAAAREMLISAAVALGGGDRSTYTAALGRVTNTANGQSWLYGTLAPTAQTMVPPTNPPLTASSQFTLIGKPLPRPDIPAKVDGSAVFGIDVRLPNMLYAAVKHCPTIGGTLATTPSVPNGAIAVVPLGNAVAVVAANTWLAMQAVAQLRVNWNIPASSSALDSAQILSQAQQLLQSGPAVLAESVGDAITALRTQVAAGKSLNLTYSLPYLAHATMEVMNCTAVVTAQSCEIWVPTQAQAFVVSTARRITGLPASSITVHTTLLGGGLGRKFEQDYVAQAITVAKSLAGRPVKLTWTREQDFGNDQYRPMGLVQVQTGLDPSGQVVAWSCRNVSPSIAYQRNNAAVVAGGVDNSAVEGATQLPYGIANRRVDWVRHPAAVPVGYWRSVGHSINCFAVESSIDELAVLANVDPVQFRRNMLANNPTCLAVLNAAAELAGWSTPVPTGSARGVALSVGFGSTVATVVELTQAGGAMKVLKVACVIDCGPVINPDSVEAQIQSAIVHGMSSSLWGQVTFDAGIASASNFNNHRMMRIVDMPRISVRVMPSAAALGGVGEPGVPPIAPALANAWARLTGKRLRSLPMFPNANTMTRI